MLFDRRHLARKDRLSDIGIKHNAGKWLLVSALAVSGWFGYRTVQGYLAQPEAVFVLGGHEAREKFAADLAKEHPELDIWVSSGSPQDYVTKIFTFRGISSDRLHLDYQAEDTVGNFTTLVDKLKDRGIDSVYLITSDSHMPRARIVGEIIFGSRGIAIKPISVPSQSPPEPPEKCLRDGARAILWLATGYTGSAFKK
ncbi:conserved hypothetical protein [Hyella patelloides LEGE 07179]|uniref:DUF218 domain-containing protein n=2 Tax=Hyella TaxID=945733 RepID=A0A563VLV5_9CYAN|nr:conserved hypothetical protein [Hyella patelloides LEGE 07179]